MGSTEKLVRVCLLIAVAGSAACANGVESASSRQESVAVQAQALFEVNCADSSQAALLEQASADAQALLFDARLEVSALGGGGDPTNFETWLGSTDDQDRVARAANNIERALSAARTVPLECGCPPGTDPSTLAIEIQPGDQVDPIQVCSGYFDSRQPYEEIQVGVLIHEYMHAIGMADLQLTVPCDDASIRDRAATDPDSAVLNPENYRLFALHWQPGQRQSSAYCQDNPSAP